MCCQHKKCAILRLEKENYKRRGCMSFTIEDMMLTAENRYAMKFLAGKMAGLILLAGCIFWKIQRLYRISGERSLQ